MTPSAPLAPSVAPERPIYLDHNATTPLLPEVVEAMLPYLWEHFGNPSSGHAYGRRAKAAVDQAREQVAALIGASADEVLFTSGGTEANNLAIRGAAAARPHRRRLLTSNVEHPATARPLAALVADGWALHTVPVDGEGRLRADLALACIEEVGSQLSLVSVMHANNETGALQPIGALAGPCQERGVMFHTDAAQSAGKVELDVEALGVDLLTLAGHKLYAPKGVGALYVRRGTPLLPFTLGAGHERGLRPGTENVASIVGLGAAAAAVGADLSAQRARTTALRDTLEAALRARVPGLTLNGPREARLPNTLNVRFPGTSGEALLARCPEVAASTGSACHAGGERASAVILAMGVPEAEALGSVRLSLGRGTTAAEVEAAAVILAKAWAQSAASAISASSQRVS